MATAELAAKLARRNQLNETIAAQQDTENVEKPTNHDTISNSTPTPTSAPDTTKPPLVTTASSRELAEKLDRRNKINEGKLRGEMHHHKDEYLIRDFPEFSMKQISDLKERFAQADLDKDGSIRLEDLKKLLERLGQPQTHFSLRNLLKDMQIEKDNDFSLRDFLQVLRRLQAGNMESLTELMTQQSIDVSEVGVSGAKSFFEAKQKEVMITSVVDYQVKAQQEAARIAREEQLARKKSFQQRIASFDK